VAENILLGLDEPRFVMNLAKYEQKISEMGEKFGLHMDPKAKIWQLSVGEQQRVEILKMLYRGANILIMDEPTSVLAPSEIEDLFKTLRVMTAEGKSIIFISHKLTEVMAISDRVTVLRKGKLTSGGVETRSTDRAGLARLMVGRDVIFSLDKQQVKAGEIVLSVGDIHAENDKGLNALRGVSLNVRAGEIVGLAGVAGNGQSELAEVIAGLRQATSGKIIVQQEDITNKPINFGIRRGVSLVPEDRIKVGTAPNLSVTDNMIMKKYHDAPIGHGWVLNAIAADKYASDLKLSFDIMAPSIKTSVRLLSGGNLQKVILAREISCCPKLMIAVQPTRGLDVGAIEELEELLALSDRIYVIYEGKIMGEVKDNNVEKIGLMMTGTSLEEIEKQGVKTP
jgi:simple sugar transport system ATP-binding protein